MALVESYTDCSVAVITLNNSENGNRLNYDSLQSISKMLNSSLLNDDVRVILFRSNGKNFCLGMDLEFLQQENENIELGRESISLYVDLLLKIFQSPKPVVALINGDVKAGGMGLVGACDIILSSDVSTFELSEVLLGLIPANVLPFLFSLRLPPQKARYLILTAKRLDAAEAKALNIVDEVFPADEMEKGVKSVLKGLFRAAPHAVAETKHFTQKLLGKNLLEATNMAKEKLLELIGNPKVIEGITSFNEGGIPSWFGKCKLEKPLILGESDE